jgi:hypothetical protein
MRRAIADDLRVGRLEAVLEEWRVRPEVAIHSLIRSGSHLPPIVRGFVYPLASRLGATGQRRCR